MKKIILCLLFISSVLLPSCKNGDDEVIIPPVFSITTIDVISPVEVMAHVSITTSGNKSISHGLAWAKTPSPTVTNDKKQFSPLEGSADIQVIGLLANTKYYFRYYALDANGDATYSNEVSVTTALPQAISFSPDRGNLGSEITLTGTNIKEGVVKFDGVVAEWVLGSNTVKVPAGINKQKIKITVDVAGTTVTFPADFYFLKGAWVQMKNFPGSVLRYNPGFSINSFGYAGLEFSKKDFWKYDPAANDWIQVEDFPGTGGPRCAAFTIDSKAYVISGPKNEVWQYNPATGHWTKMKDFTGPTRDLPGAFSIDGKGYYGLGNNIGGTKDFWKYDPLADSWTQLNNFAGPVRNNAVALSLNGKGYVATGLMPDGQVGYYADLWEYSPLTDSWLKKKDLPATARAAAVAFTLNNKIYVGCGSNQSGSLRDFWEYDPAADEWSQVASLPYERAGAFSFVIGNKAYVGSGIAFDTNTFWRLDL